MIPERATLPDPAEVVPSIDGERAELWLYGSLRLEVSEDSMDLLTKRTQINTAARQWMRIQFQRLIGSDPEPLQDLTRQGYGFNEDRGTGE